MKEAPRTKWFSGLAFSSELFPILDCPNHDSPDLEVVIDIDADGLELSIGRTKLDVALMAMGKVKIFDSELLVDVSDNHISVPWLYGTVDDRNVAITDAGLYHRIALHTCVERGLRVGDEVTIEVERIMPVVLGRRGEASLDGFSELEFKLRLEVSMYDLYFGHTFVIFLVNNRAKDIVFCRY